MLKIENNETSYYNCVCVTTKLIAILVNKYLYIFLILNII